MATSERVRHAHGRKGPMNRRGSKGGEGSLLIVSKLSLDNLLVSQEPYKSLIQSLKPVSRGPQEKQVRSKAVLGLSLDCPELVLHCCSLVICNASVVNCLIPYEIIK